MESGTLILIAILILAVSGFVFLAHTLIAVRRYFSQGKGSQSSKEVAGSSVGEAITPEDCYDECMKKAGWASSQAHLCALACNL